MEQYIPDNIEGDIEAAWHDDCEDVMSSWGGPPWRGCPEWADELPDYWDFREDWLREYASDAMTALFDAAKDSDAWADWMDDNLYCERLMEAYAQYLIENIGTYVNLPTLARYKEHFDSTYRTRYAWAA